MRRFARSCTSSSLALCSAAAPSPSSPSSSSSSTVPCKTQQKFIRFSGGNEDQNKAPKSGWGAAAKAPLNAGVSDAPPAAGAEKSTTASSSSGLSDEAPPSIVSFRAKFDNSALVSDEKPKEDLTKYDHGPRRQTGLWSVNEIHDSEKGTIDFRRIDDIESDIIEDIAGRDTALVLQEDEKKWKNKLMFEHKFKKTPKHLTWAEFGKEIGCMDCVIDLDEHRPEEIFIMTWYYVNRQTGTRDVMWSARNNVAVSESFTDLLAAIGSCMGRPDVHRTMRFDDGLGTTRELNIRKNSRYTSEVVIAFRPEQHYNMYDRKYEQDAYNAEMEEQGLSTWGFHPDLMDPEYRDTENPEGTYTLTLSSHAFCFVMLQALERLLCKPMQEYYRPSQQATRQKVQKSEDIGVSRAMMGWLGADESIWPHFTPIEAVQDHFLGSDSPFTLISIINKLREMCYLKKKNPEYHSWVSVRKHETALAIRNTTAKLLGAGASTLFLPTGHNSTINAMLPKSQQRNIKAKVSINHMLNLPDETRKLDEFKQITGHDRITASVKISKTRSGDDVKDDVVTEEEKVEQQQVKAEQPAEEVQKEKPVVGGDEQIVETSAAAAADGDQQPRKPSSSASAVKKESTSRGSVTNPKVAAAPGKDASSAAQAFAAMDRPHSTRRPTGANATQYNEADGDTGKEFVSTEIGEEMAEPEAERKPMAAGKGANFASGGTKQQ